MREIFDAIDSAPVDLVIAALVAFLALIVALEYFVKWIRWTRAHEYLQGYALGYRDGRDRKIPIVQLPHEDAIAIVDVPDVYAKAFRK